MNAFDQYLKAHHVEAYTVSVVLGVRYLTVWNAVKGLPIRVEQAQKIRTGVQHMTGVVYDGPLVTLPERPVDQLPTLPLKRQK